MNSVNNVSDTFEETSIDFTNYTIIAIFLEVKTHGWEIEITEIIENEAVINVSVEDEEFISSIIIQPFYIAKIPKTNKGIEVN